MVEMDLYHYVNGQYFFPRLKFLNLVCYRINHVGPVDSKITSKFLSIAYTFSAMKRWAQDLPFQLKNAVQNVLVVPGSLTDTQNHAIMECVKYCFMQFAF